MIRYLLSILRPAPVLRVRFESYVPPVRWRGETLAAFRARQLAAVLRESNLGGVYEHEGES